jgi:hypothetical protein
MMLLQHGRYARENMADWSHVACPRTAQLLGGSGGSGGRPDSSCVFPVQRVWKQRHVCLMGEHGVLPVDVPWKAGGARNVEAVYEHLPEFDAEQRKGQRARERRRRASMAKYAIVVMSEHSEGNPGGQARLLHALSAEGVFHVLRLEGHCGVQASRRRRSHMAAPRATAA